MRDFIEYLHDRGGRDLNAEEIADLLWLAAQLPRPGDEDARPDEGNRTGPGRETQAGDPGQEKPDEPEKPAPPPQPTDEKRADAYLPGSQREDGSGPGIASLPFRSPGVTALPQRLALGRALRPLKRTAPSPTRLVLDEAATVQRIADEGNWLPVLRPARERWLEVVILADESPSMTVWYALVGELQALLEQSGAFRTVQRWGFYADPERPDALRFYAGSRFWEGSARYRSPAELNDPRGRRLILLVSDCVSAAWRQPHLTKFLADWKDTPATLVQVLPERLWGRTGLRFGREAALRARQPGQPNASLLVQPRRLLDGDRLPAGFPLPVVTLEPETLALWSQGLTAKGSGWMLGVLFPRQNAPPLAPPQPAGERPRPDAQRILDAFRKTASEEAQRLARYLSAVPLNLPVMRLVQEVMFDEPRQSHLAEVLLSGLFQRRPDQAREIRPDWVEYDFIDGAREHLRRTAGERELLIVLSRTSVFVDAHTGLPIDFPTLLADPSQAGSLRIDEKSLPFAAIAIETLRHIGGSQAHLAQYLAARVGGNASVSTVPAGITAEKTVAIRNALYDSDAISRSAAVRALGRLAGSDAETREAVRNALYDPAAIVRSAAVRALGRLAGSDTEIRGTVTNALHDSGAIVRSAAVSALSELAGTDAEIRDAIRNALYDSDAIVRSAAVSALGSLTGSDAEIRDAITNALHDSGTIVRSAAVSALSKLAGTDAEIRDAIRDALHDSDAIVRSAAVSALSELAGTDAEIRDAIRDALHDSDAIVRSAAVSALSKLAGTDAEIRDAVRNALYDSGTIVRSAAVSALSKLAGIDAEIRDAIRNALYDSDAIVRGAAVSALGELAGTDAEVRNGILIRLNDSDKEIRKSVVSVLENAYQGIALSTGAAGKFKNFDIAIWGTESPYTVVASYREQTGYGSFLHDALQPNWAETIQVLAQTHTPPSERFILNVGGLLFDELFQGGIRDLWVEARAAMQNDRHQHLRLRLDLQPPAIAALPWETLADPRRRRTLAADRSIALVRLATDMDIVDRSRSLQSQLPAKILIVAVEEPDNIDATTEIDRIRAILTSFVPDQIDLEVLSGRIDIRSLRRRLQESRPDILHVISHGEADGLYLWEDGELALASASQLAATLALVDSVKLVFLNACLAGQPDHTTLFASLAQRLLQTGIPAVIAMQFVVQDRAASDFAGFLYEALINGPSPGAIDVAMSIARSGLYISDPDRIDYVAPLLWLNSKDGIILQFVDGSLRDSLHLLANTLPSIPPDALLPLFALEIAEKEKWFTRLPVNIRVTELRFDYTERKKQIEKLLRNLRESYASLQVGNGRSFLHITEQLAVFNDERRSISGLLDRLR